MPESLTSLAFIIVNKFQAIRLYQILIGIIKMQFTSAKKKDIIESAAKTT